MNPSTNRWLTLVALVLSLLVVGLDLTVLNLALPTLAGALKASTADLQWFVDAYTLVLAAMLLPAGILGDRYGRRRMLLLALAVFGLASLLCAYSTSPAMLIAGRALLGVGAAFVMPLSFSILPVMFDEDERPKAVAAVAAANFLAFPIGPILGGWLLKNYWWGSVFLINVPVILLALVAVALLMPESRSSRRLAIDIPGVALSSAGLVGLTWGAIEAGSNGWSDFAALLSLAAGAILLGLFWAWEQRAAAGSAIEALVDLTLFRHPAFTWGTILAMTGSLATFGVLFLLPQYLQGVRAIDAQGTGFRVLPLIGGLIVGAALGQRLARPLGNKLTLAAGFLVLAVGLALGGLTSKASTESAVLTWTIICGFGFGMAMPTAMNAALAELSAERSGSGSALMLAMRQVGATIGVAVLGSLLNGAYRSHLELGRLPAPLADAAGKGLAGGIAVATRLHSPAMLDAVRSAFVNGLDTALWACCGIALLGCALAIAFMPQRSRTATTADSATTARAIAV